MISVKQWEWNYHKETKIPYIKIAYAHGYELRIQKWPKDAPHPADNCWRWDVLGDDNDMCYRAFGYTHSLDTAREVCEKVAIAMNGEPDERK